MHCGTLHKVAGYALRDIGLRGIGLVCGMLDCGILHCGMLHCGIYCCTMGRWLTTGWRWGGRL